MIAAPPRPCPAPASTVTIRAEEASLSRREVRRLLRRLGRFDSLLRTIAAAPRPAQHHRDAAV